MSGCFGVIGGMKMTEEQRKWMRDFIKSQFGDNVTEEELNGSDEQLEKLHREAYSYSEWGI